MHSNLIHTKSKFKFTLSFVCLFVLIYASVIWSGHFIKHVLQIQVTEMSSAYLRKTSMGVLLGILLITETPIPQMRSALSGIRAITRIKILVSASQGCFHIFSHIFLWDSAWRHKFALCHWYSCFYGEDSVPDRKAITLGGGRSEIRCPGGFAFQLWHKDNMLHWKEIVHSIASFLHHYLFLFHEKQLEVDWQISVVLYKRNKPCHCPHRCVWFLTYYITLFIIYASSVLEAWLFLLTQYTRTWMD